MNGSKNYGTFSQWNTRQQKERRSPYPLRQHGWNSKHYAKWNKPGGERQIPYDLTFTKFLITQLNESSVSCQDANKYTTILRNYRSDLYSDKILEYTSNTTNGKEKWWWFVVCELSLSGQSDKASCTWRGIVHPPTPYFTLYNRHFFAQIFKGRIWMLIIERQCLKYFVSVLVFCNYLSHKISCTIICSKINAKVPL